MFVIRADQNFFLERVSTCSFIASVNPEARNSQMSVRQSIDDRSNSLPTSLAMDVLRTPSELSICRSHAPARDILRHTLPHTVCRSSDEGHQQRRDWVATQTLLSGRPPCAPR